MFETGVKVFTGAKANAKSEKYLTDLKKKKDEFDMIENGVKKLWVRDGLVGAYNFNKPVNYAFKCAVYSNKSPYSLSVWIL